MENSTQDANSHLINSFMEITSSTKDEALFFLESHQWDLDAAVSTFLDDDAAPAPAAATEDSQPVSTVPAVNSPSLSNSPSTSPSSSVSRSRSRSPSPAAAREPYELRSRRRPGKKEDKKAATGTSRGGIRTLADLNRTPPGDAAGSDDDDNDDELQRYYTGGEKSCMRVQDPTRGNNVDAIFDQARESVVERPNLRPSSSSNTFTGTARLLSGETVSSAPAPPPEHVSHDITFWSNGFTVDDGPLRSMDDPANASFLESITRSECPKELEPADRRIRVHVELINKREEDYSEPPKRRSAFQGVGRTLGGSDTPASTASEPTFTGASLNTAPPPSSGLVVDASLPTTSIQLRLADGTRLVSRFNHHHTIRDIHRFIDASRPGGARNYQLQAMGFPPKQLTDLDQTVEQADIANSVVVQKL